jgi:hypothetical protein
VAQQEELHTAIQFWHRSDKEGWRITIPSATPSVRLPDEWRTCMSAVDDYIRLPDAWGVAMEDGDSDHF